MEPPRLKEGSQLGCEHATCSVPALPTPLCDLRFLGRSFPSQRAVSRKSLPKGGPDKRRIDCGADAPGEALTPGPPAPSSGGEWLASSVSWRWRPGVPQASYQATD